MPHKFSISLHNIINEVCLIMNVCLIKYECNTGMLSSAAVTSAVQYRLRKQFKREAVSNCVFLKLKLAYFVLFEIKKVDTWIVWCRDQGPGEHWECWVAAKPVWRWRCSKLEEELSSGLSSSSDEWLVACLRHWWRLICSGSLNSGTVNQIGFHLIKRFSFFSQIDF